MFSSSGSSLMEILISFCILAIFLLGCDLAIVQSFKETENTYYFAVANQQLLNLAEYFYAAQAMSEEILPEWNKQNAIVLPQGYGIIDDNSAAISIFWGENAPKNCDKNKIGQLGCLRLDLNINQ